MLSERLKEETKINHQLLEKKLIVKMRAIADLNGYTEFIGFFYGYFGGLELAINKVIDSSFLPDYSQRRKTTAIANDLRSLNCPLPTIANGKELPAITNHLQAVGALYVIEGSTLGSKIISKMLQQYLSNLNDESLSFFNGYGEQTNNMWQTFKHALDKPLTPADENLVVVSANDTIFKFSKWFDAKAHGTLLNTA